MKKWVYATILVLIIPLIALGSFEWGIHFGNSNNDIYVISATYGDNLSELDVCDINGNMVEPLESKNADYKIVLYLSSRCSSCNKEIIAASHLKAVLDKERYAVFILYEDSIPKDSALDSVNGVYCLKAEKLSSDTPTGFILDSDNNVIFSTTDTPSLIDKIISMESNEEIDMMRMRSNSYFITNYADNNDSRPVMIYFRMNGCPDCEAVEDILESNEVREKFQRVDLYTEDSFGEEELIDADQILRTIFDVDWYPSFELVSGANTKMLGEMSNDSLIKSFIDF